MLDLYIFLNICICMCNDLFTIFILVLLFFHTREGGDKKEGEWRYRGGCKDVDQVGRHHWYSAKVHLVQNQIFFRIFFKLSFKLKKKSPLIFRKDAPFAKSYLCSFLLQTRSPLIFHKDASFATPYQLFKFAFKCRDCLSGCLRQRYKLS